MTLFSGVMENLPDWWDRLVPALWLTAALTAAGYGLALLIAILIEILRTRRSPLIRAVVSLYVELVRGVPILAILFIIYFGLPGFGLTLPPFWAGVIGLAIAYGAYLAEVLRAGIAALHHGQREAAMAVGMTPIKAFRYVIFPQAVQVSLPPLLVTLISLLKDSALCALISVNELTLTAKDLMSEYFMPLPIFLFVSCFYFAAAWPLSFMARRMERRLARGRRQLGGEEPPAAVA